MQHIRCVWLFEPHTLARTAPSFRPRYARRRVQLPAPACRPRADESRERERAALRYLAALELERAA